MIEVKLYANKSEDNVVYKNVKELLSTNCNLLDECSVISPVITISTQSQNEIIQCNYCYINQMGRYYYVTDKVQIANGLWQIKLKCDVLMSFKNSFMNLPAVIERQENQYNLYLNDSSFKVYQNDRIQTKAFKQGFSNDGDYILICA